MNGKHELLNELPRLGIELVAHGDRLRYRPQSAVTADLLERLKAHKGELMPILRAAGAPKPALWQDCITPPPPCPGCGRLVFWWNPLGDRRCMACDPPATAIRLLERVQAIRRRHGKPSPIGAAEMLIDLKRLTDT